MLQAAFALFPTQLAGQVANQPAAQFKSRHEFAAENLQRTRREIPLHPNMKVSPQLVEGYVNLVVSDLKSLDGEATADIRKMEGGKYALVPTPNAATRSQLGVLKRFREGNSDAKEMLATAIAVDGEEKGPDRAHDLLLHLAGRKDAPSNPMIYGDLSRLYQRAVLDCRALAERKAGKGTLFARAHVHDNGMDCSEADMKASRGLPQVVLAVSTKNGDVEALWVQDGQRWRLGRVGTAAHHAKIVDAYKKFVGDPPAFGLKSRKDGTALIDITSQNGLRCVWKREDGNWVRKALDGKQAATEEIGGNCTAAVILDSKGNHTELTFKVAPAGIKFEAQSR